MSTRPLAIGVSAGFFYRDPQRPLFKDKTLVFFEESLTHWLAEHGAFAVLIPTLPERGTLTLNDWVAQLDGMLLAGGTDVAPENYGESPIRPEWAGDPFRDQYESNLIREFRRQKKPILGICRGLQILNVALGGSMYQDIATQVPETLSHRVWEIYDRNFHEITFTEGSRLREIFPTRTGGKIISVHHQAVKRVAPGLRVEALGTDGIIESVRNVDGSFAVGYQWHPEFQDAGDSTLLPGTPLLNEFLTEARQQRGA